MSGLHIHEELCRGCGLCLKVCAAGALSMQDRKAAVDASKCAMCSMCLDACRFHAITMEKETETVGLDAYKGVMVFVELTDDGPAQVAFELTGKGRELSDTLHTRLTAVVVGCGTELYADPLIAAGADEVILCDAETYRDRLEGAVSKALISLIRREKPEIVLFGATVFGRSLAPRVAAALRTGLTADCTVLRIDPETRLLQQTRPAFGGNLMATIICAGTRPQMATVRPGIMRAPEPDPARHGTVRYDTAAPAADTGTELLDSIRTLKAASIRDARLILDVGRGIGSQKNLKLAKHLADMLGAELGCSRPLVDTGWAEYSHQIGQTGSAVAPELLLTLGVSGAIQHLAGISGAKTVIAVNSDPDAPIFSVAQYKIVGDCTQILREMVRALEKTQESA